MSKTKTAGLIIIGNEILSGKVRDENSFFAVRELRSLGIDVKRISVIPDETDIIGKEAVFFSEHYDYVFTSGGVGPTHDDVTVEAIAGGFGVKLVRNEEIRKVLISRYSKEPNAAVLKMTEIPEGALVVFRDNMRFPVISFRNIFIFPGIPEYFKNKFSAIKEQFRSQAFHLKRVFLNSHETEIAEVLNSVVSANNGVVFGSYPILGETDYRIIITAESKFEESLNKAVDELLQLLPSEAITRVE
jgi:molybdenum cofactor synthesis domain-containing protein